MHTAYIIDGEQYSALTKFFLQWEIDAHHIRLGKVLGEGEFGRVVQADICRGVICSPPQGFNVPSQDVAKVNNAGCVNSHSRRQASQTQSTKGGQGGGIPPLEKIPYVVKLHPPPPKIAPYVVHPPSALGFESLVVCVGRLELSK